MFLEKTLKIARHALSSTVMYLISIMVSYGLDSCEDGSQPKGHIIQTEKSEKNFTTLRDDNIIEIIGHCDLVSFYRMGQVSHRLQDILKLRLINPLYTYPLAKARTKGEAQSALIQWISSQLPKADKSEDIFNNLIGFLRKLTKVNVQIIDRDFGQEFFDAFMTYFQDVSEEQQLFCLADRAHNTVPGSSEKELALLPSFLEDIAEVLNPQTLPESKDKSQRSACRQDLQEKLETWQPYAVALFVSYAVSHPIARLYVADYDDIRAHHNQIPYLPTPRVLVIQQQFDDTLFYFHTLRQSHDLLDQEALKAFLLGKRQSLSDLARTMRETHIEDRLTNLYPEIDFLETRLSDAQASNNMRVYQVLSDALIRAYEGHLEEVNKALQLHAFSKSQAFKLKNVYQLIGQREAIHDKLCSLYATIGAKFITAGSVSSKAGDASDGAQYYWEAAKLGTKRLELLGGQAVAADVEDTGLAYRMAADLLKTSRTSDAASCYLKAAKLMMRYRIMEEDKARLVNRLSPAALYFLGAEVLETSHPSYATHLYLKAAEMSHEELENLGSHITLNTFCLAMIAYKGAANLLTISHPLQAAQHYSEAAKLSQRALEVLPLDDLGDDLGDLIRFSAEMNDKVAKLRITSKPNEAAKYFLEAGKLYVKWLDLLGDEVTQKHVITAADAILNAEVAQSSIEAEQLFKKLLEIRSDKISQGQKDYGVEIFKVAKKRREELMSAQMLPPVKDHGFER